MKKLQPLFQVFATREDFKKMTGLEPPPWDPSKAPKRWADSSVEDGFAVYDAQLVVKQGFPVRDAAGKPMAKRLILLEAIAKAVNIPPTVASANNLPEILCPFQPPKEGEFLAFASELPANKNNAGIRFKAGTIEDVVIATAEDLVDSNPDEPVAFTAADKKALHNIAQALGLE